VRRSLALAATMITLTTALAPAQSNAPPPASGYTMPPPDMAVMSRPDGRESHAPRGFVDRRTRCLSYGASIGVPADQMSDYIKRCVLQ
jgi:hypothetical protein